jgi:hypothetical protein
VAAGRGDEQGALGVVLAFHIDEVLVQVGMLGEKWARFNDGRFRVTAEAKLRPLARLGSSIVEASVDAVRRAVYPASEQMDRKLSRFV